MLVTGGKGFMGGALVDALVDRGDQVIVMDNQLSSEVDFHINAKAEYIDQDVANLAYYGELMEKHGRFDAIFHLAALSTIGDCFEKPALAVLDNVLGTVNILEYARYSRPHKVVLTSTCALYSEKDYPFTESSEIDFKNPYSLTKGHAEDYFKAYSEIYQVETSVLRLFNVYGPRANKSSIIEKLFKQKENGEKVTIYGSGEQTRDYVHVDDVVSALIAASESGIGLSGKTFNVGSGKDYSVNDLVKMILGPDADVNYGVPRVGEIDKAKADISSIKENLKWKPKNKLESYIQKRLKA